MKSRLGRTAPARIRNVALLWAGALLAAFGFAVAMIGAREASVPLCFYGVIMSLVVVIGTSLYAVARMLRFASDLLKRLSRR